MHIEYFLIQYRMILLYILLFNRSGIFITTKKEEGKMADICLESSTLNGCTGHNTVDHKIKICCDARKDKCKYAHHIKTDQVDLCICIKDIVIKNTK